MTIARENKDQDEALHSYFERSAALVRQSFRSVEREKLRPAFQMLMASFQTRPIRSTFFTVFACFSFFPVLSFIGFSLFILASFTFLALAGALLASTFAILLFAGVIAFTLTVLFFVAIFFTTAILTCFLAARLVLLMRQDGPRAALIEWKKEALERFYNREQEQRQDDHRDRKSKHEPKRIQSRSTREPDGRIDEDSKSDVSGGVSDTLTAGSTVMVDVADGGNEPPKEESDAGASPVFVKKELE